MNSYQIKETFVDKQIMSGLICNELNGDSIVQCKRYTLQTLQEIKKTFLDDFDNQIMNSFNKITDEHAISELKGKTSEEMALIILQNYPISQSEKQLMEIFNVIIDCMNFFSFDSDLQETKIIYELIKLGKIDFNNKMFMKLLISCFVLGEKIIKFNAILLTTKNCFIIDFYSNKVNKMLGYEYNKNMKFVDDNEMNEIIEKMWNHFEPFVRRYFEHLSTNEILIKSCFRTE
jgi:hypothetical protein